jgi:AAA+ ATPase superfamily predicted ATPase
MFVGRERELSVLRERYDSPSFEFVGIYGRRRVGKTSLISQFVRDLPCGYCTAIEDDASANLRLLSRAVHSLANPDANEEIAPLYSSFSDAIDAAFAHARTRRCVLVIDEFPYLAKSYPAFPSILQAAIDRNKDESGLFLILCGSSL